MVSLPANNMQTRFELGVRPVWWWAAARSLFQHASLCIAVFLPSCAAFVEAQATPSEALGPYNAVFLPDGEGLTKPLVAPAHPDSRTAALERLGLSREPEAHDKLQGGHAAWTLAFWFRSADSLTGALLVAGIGNPEAEDARFIGVQDRHLALWLGRGAGSSKMITGNRELSADAWHQAVATSDGAKVTLYADGDAIATGTQTQGELAAQLHMAPPIVDGVASRHFGGQICGLRVYRETLTAQQARAMADALMRARQAAKE